MHLAFHGGKCCGIKTIYGFGNGPDEMTEALPALKQKDNSDIFYNTVSSDKRFFHLAAPQETRLERLDRYLAFLRENRPKHIVEVTLAETLQEGYHDQKVWFPLLEERGFIRVNKAKNSNSGNIVHVFHLNLE